MFILAARGHHREMVRCKMGRSFGIKVVPTNKTSNFVGFLGTMPLGEMQGHYRSNVN